MITFLKNKYIFIFLLSIVLCINVHSEPFFKRDVLPYHVQNIGGCKIISIYKNKPPSSMLLDWCKKIPSAQKKGLNTWHDYYSSIELDLGSAFEIAERSLGGSKYSISRNRAVHIVLYPGQYANAAVSVHPKENEIVIFLNEGIIDLIEGTVSSVALEFGALLGEQICGVTFSDWLELMRTPCINGDKANYMPGPDQAQTDNFWPIWYSKNRINCNINYQFIFAHELAHIQRNDLLHAIPNDPLKVEIDCDVRAFKAFARNNDTDKAVFVVVPFFLAMWYYEKYWSEEILQSGLPVYQGIQPALYTRNWKERSKQIIESWGSNATINNFAKKIELLRQLKKYINLRAPLPINELNISVLKNVQINLLDIKFDKPPIGTKVHYKYSVVNEGKQTIDIAIEVQSRYFSRDSNKIFSKRAPHDDKGRRYFVYSINTYPLRIKPGGTGLINGVLDWYGNSFVYPGINTRVVSALYLD